ncbi:MAG: FkbM family methyltransferase [Candidatus Omnitrophica bacterium]|nr:FkbM family methyltransferase [Candidatus Omnitrophota bacterium]MBU4487482.1 FkbM family methyltransferase [Candidatus Omnitrophota bacterium]MCG2705128.1 FkbM family methyltransferase [Candidatus Omnitrophota bacterium]
MARGILRKNLDLAKHYGLIRTFRIYARTLVWYLYGIMFGWTKRYKKLVVNGYPMYVDLKDKGISKALFVYGSREKDQMHLVKDNIKRGSTVLDIGANIGYYVLLEAGIIGPSGRIIAYEPSSDNCLLLNRNIAANGLTDKVEVNNAALSNRSGTSRFYLSSKSNLHTLNPVHYKGGAKRSAEEKFIDVRTVDVYAVLNQNRDVKFIRMDIEGHEVEVLEGILRAVRDFKIYPDILFETHFAKYDPSGHDIESRLKALFGLGYIPAAITSTDESAPNVKEIKERGYKPKLVIDTDRVNRGIYEKISPDDAVNFICNTGGVRAVLLKKD